jgi:hypothetical protein
MDQVWHAFRPLNPNHFPFTRGCQYKCHLRALFMADGELLTY